MRKRTSPNLSLALAFCLLAAPLATAQRPTVTPLPALATNSQSAPAQQPTPRPSPGESEEEVVRITSNLVQVDAVVTDRDGKQVTDLAADEIEIFEDGRPQKITNFSYISNEPDAATATTVKSAPSTTTPAGRVAPPPVRLRPEQVRRTVALVADDICASFESIAYIRRALKKFVDEQMQPTDLVSITRTIGGVSALQNFTSNRQQLYAAIERVRWSPLSTRCANSLAPLEGSPFAQTRDQNPTGQNDPSERIAGQDAQNFSEQIFAVGTLGALNYLVRGLRQMPGRKAVILFSDGIPLFDNKGERNDRVMEAVNRLTDLANRASVVLYTIDARGLQTLSLTAADNTSGMTPQQVQERLSDRRRGFSESQNGLIYLAEQTGGFAIRNANDISQGIRRVLDDQRGYYLIGYRPDEKTFDSVKGRREFHRLTAKVKRPGLKVRLRSGFYGITEEAARPAPKTRVEQLTAALNTPFSPGGVGLRLTTLFAADAKQGAFVRSMLHINARDLTFVAQPDGWQQAVIDVLAVTFVENGSLVDQVNTTHTMRTRGQTYEFILKNGLVFNLNVPIKKPGAYQFRIAVRDTASERVGAASQFIEVPNLNKDRLALSGLVVTSGDNGAATGVTNTQGATDGAATEPPTTPPDPQSGPAVRRFRRGNALDYFFYIYNAKTERAGGQPQLETQVKLFRDGQPVFTGQPAPFDATGQPDLKRISAGGRLRLGSNLAPGEYLLQVIVTDRLAREKSQVATQWIDFEIIN